jgi:hypothetical protein
VPAEAEKQRQGLQEKMKKANVRSSGEAMHLRVKAATGGKGDLLRRSSGNFTPDDLTAGTRSMAHQVSPLAPGETPRLPAIAGVTLAAAETGIRYKGTGRMCCWPSCRRAPRWRAA